MSFKQKVILATYYSFTTLSTVGLGDLSPRCDNERLLAVFVMLFGVLSTSLLMENFSLMLKTLSNYNKQYEESQALNLFIGTLRKFNEDQAIAEDQVK